MDRSISRVPFLGSIDDDLERLGERAMRIAEDLGVDYWISLDEGMEFPWEALKALGGDGLLSTMVPRKLGGLEMGVMGLSATIEDFAAAGPGLGAYLLLSNSIIASLLAEVGSKSQKEELLPSIIDGSSIVCLGLAEAASGSDALSISTRAERKSDIYVLKGTKDYVNNSEKSLFIIVVARTTPIEDVKKRSQGLTLFIVDPELPGVKHEPHEKLGMRYYTTNKVILDDVRVPEENVIGEVDKGWQYLTYMFNADRIATAAMLVGASKYLLDLATDYAKNRVVFGKPIGSNQAIQHRIAEVYLRTVEARLMTYKAAEIYDAGRSAVIEATSAYTEAAEAAWEAAEAAVQIFSAQAYLKHVDVERHWRDIRLYRFAPLSRELALSIIAEYGLGLPRSY